MDLVDNRMDSKDMVVRTPDMQLQLDNKGTSSTDMLEELLQEYKEDKS